jgi:hypothetical protein
LDTKRIIETYRCVMPNASAPDIFVAISSITMMGWEISSPSLMRRCSAHSRVILPVMLWMHCSNSFGVAHLAVDAQHECLNHAVADQIIELA